jgi:hypothetical protein
MWPVTKLRAFEIHIPIRRIDSKLGDLQNVRSKDSYVSGELLSGAHREQRICDTGRRSVVMC